MSSQTEKQASPRRHLLFFFSRFLLFGLILFALNFSFFKDLLSFGPFVGIDTGGHIALGHYYSQAIFPDSWGWAFQWQGGMPYPQFYPPLFSMAMALFDHVLPHHYDALYLAFALLLSLLVPVLVSTLSFRYTRDTFQSWIAGFVTVLLMSIFGVLNAGLTLGATFIIGIVTQLLGFVFLLLWLHLVEDSFHKKNIFIVCTFILAFVLLSNAFIAPLVFVMAALFLGVKSYWSKEDVRPIAGKLFLMFFLAFTLVSFWYVPLLLNYQFVNTYTMSLSLRGPFFSLDWVLALLGSLLALLFSYKARMERMFFFSAIACACFLVGLVSPFLKNLPIQPIRFLASGYLFSGITLAYCVRIVSKKFYFSAKIFSAVLLFLLFIPYLVHIYDSALVDPLFGATPEEVKELKAFLQGKKGRISIEVADGARQLNSLLVDSNTIAPPLESNYEIFTESSINSGVMTGMRNAISGRSEFLPVYSYIGNWPDFRKLPLDSEIDRAVLLGIKFFIVRSQFMVEHLSHSPRLALHTFGTWKIFEINDPVPFAERLANKPILVFAPLSYKKRDVSSYDFLRFSEELFISNKKSIVLVWAGDKNLDAIPVDLFGGLMIADYRYHDLGKAERLIQEFSQKKPVVLFSSKDPLYGAMKNMHTNAYFVERAENATGTLPVRNQMDVVYSMLAEKMVTSGNIAVPVQFYKNTISVDSFSDEERPVLIRESYFPFWQKEKAHDVYLASPGFMLFFSSRPFELHFKKPLYVVICQGISFSVASLLLLLVFLDKKKRED